jgi:virginiamycin B lyase
VIDARTNVAWFGEESFLGNKITKFDINEEKFHEYPLFTEKARPHTGAVARDGMYWQALAHDHDPAKLASVNPETGEVTQYYWPEKAKTPAHTLTIDHKGNIWFSGSPSGEIWTFDVSKKEFKAYTYPAPTVIPKGSRQDLEHIPGDAEQAPIATTYDAVEDHEGMIWFSQVAIGSLLRFDPTTGKTKAIKPEGAVSIRGIAVDNNDNLWFGDYHGHRFGRINVKTLNVKFYKAPTPNFTPYGVSFNKVDGNIWFADLNGNNITRFNPTTEHFTEFRIPSHPDHSYARFIGADGKGRMWFTEWFGDKIGYVDPSGGEDNRSLASARQ